MILTDTTIKRLIGTGEIGIYPLNKENIGTNSVDLTLSNVLKVYKDKVLDSRAKNEVEELFIPEYGLVLEPNKLYLACTNERTYTPNHVPKIEGKSSLGRLGIFVHVTAGFGDVGFNGYWTLELVVVEPVRVYAGDKICQISFLQISEPPQVSYDKKESAKYNNQGDKPMESLNYLNK